MERPQERLRALARLFACLPLLVGCASQQAMQRSLDENEAELRSLREERARLKERLQEAEGDRERLQASLAEANVRRSQPPQAAPASAGGPSLSGFDGLDLPVELRDGRVVITLPSAVSFASGKAELSAEGQRSLRKLSERLKQEYGSGADFHIEGHTDADPIQRSSFESNRALSLARAMAVLKFLVEECQVPDEQFVVVGHGQYRPLGPEGSAAAKARNRRVEIVVHAR